MSFNLLPNTVSNAASHWFWFCETWFMPWTWKPFQPLILLTNRKFVLWCCKYEATVRWWHRFILLGQLGEFVVFKRILRCFQLCYGLKINFCKSNPLSIANVQRNWLNFWQATFYAKWSVFLSIVNSYLGSNVENFGKKIIFVEEVVPFFMGQSYSYKTHPFKFSSLLHASTKC